MALQPYTVQNITRELWQAQLYGIHITPQWSCVHMCVCTRDFKKWSHQRGTKNLKKITERKLKIHLKQKREAAPSLHPALSDKGLRSKLAFFTLSKILYFSQFINFKVKYFMQLQVQTMCPKLNSTQIRIEVFFSSSHILKLASRTAKGGAVYTYSVSTQCTDAMYFLSWV